jgi:SnoaL-like domain
MSTAEADEKSDLLPIVMRYFELADSDPLGAEMFALFDDDLEFYFPKFGISRGKEGFREFAQAMGGVFARAAHHPDEFRFVVSGPSVVVEGTTEGETLDGGSWHGGQTPGGRFCSVFELDPERGLIRRMYIYLDPDYASRNSGDFHWPRDSGRGW